MSDSDTTEAKLNELTEKLEESQQRIAELSRENAKWRRQAQGKDSISQDEYDKAVDRAEAAEKKAADLEKSTKKLTADLEAATKRAEAAEGASTKLLADNALGEALAKAGITNPAHQKAVKAMFAGDVQVIADGDAKVAKIGDKAVVDALTEWAGTDEGKNFVSAPDTSGPGTRGVHSRNDNDKGDFGGSRTERAAAIASKFPELKT